MIFLQPHTLDELAAALRHCAGTPALLAGCTDFLARRNGAAWSEETAIDLLQIPELRDIRADGDSLFIGATCTHDCAAHNAEAAARFPALAQACAGVGSWQIRNRGTLGGSVCNASPAGDIFPVLLVYRAEAVVMNADGARRCVPVDDFITGQGKTCLAPREVLLGFTLPYAAAGSVSAFRKLGDRAVVTIAKIGLAAALELDGDRIAGARVALGAVAQKAFLSEAASAALVGTSLHKCSGADFGAVLSGEISRSIPGRASLPYKRAAVCGLAEDLLLALQK